MTVKLILVHFKIGQKDEITLKMDGRDPKSIGLKVLLNEAWISSLMTTDWEIMSEEELVD